jgi:hypothetical protein
MGDSVSDFGPLSSPAMVTLHHLNHSRPLCCDLCHERIGWTWEFSSPSVLVYCDSCRDTPPSRFTRAAELEKKEVM